MEKAVAFCVVQDSVEELPWVMDVGFADREQLAGGGGGGGGGGDGDGGGGGGGDGGGGGGGGGAEAAGFNATMELAQVSAVLNFHVFV